MDLPHNVKIGVYNQARLENLWEKVRQFPTTFADGTRDIESFVNRILAPNSVVLELDGGIILIENIVPGLKAEFHATFWDRKLSARTDTLQHIILWAFFTFRLERLETYVASFARAVRRFLTQRLGFVYEGTKRNAYQNRGVLYNLDIFSILREEVFDGPR